MWWDEPVSVACEWLRWPLVWLRICRAHLAPVSPDATNSNISECYSNISRNCVRLKCKDGTQYSGCLTSTTSMAQALWIRSEKTQIFPKKFWWEAHAKFSILKSQWRNEGITLFQVLYFRWQWHSASHQSFWQTSRFVFIWNFQN